jgi:hypothetical protein
MEWGDLKSTNAPLCRAEPCPGQRIIGIVISLKIEMNTFPDE